MKSELTVDEETRHELIEFGYVRDMMALGERLPSDVVVWMMEHGIPQCTLSPADQSRF